MKGEPVYTLYPEAGLPMDEAHTQEGLNAIAIMPVIHDNRVIACLNIASHTFEEVPQISRFLLEALITYIGSAIARSKAEEELKIFKAIIDTSNEAIAISDHNGNLVYINPAHERLFGRTLEEVQNEIRRILVESQSTLFKNE